MDIERMDIERIVNRLLGRRAKDKVTGFTGVISTVAFDLYGCVQVIASPPVDDKGIAQEGRWFDEKRMEILDHQPVMALPTFNSIPGPESKPAFTSPPIR